MNRCSFMETRVPQKRNRGPLNRARPHLPTSLLWGKAHSGHQREPGRATQDLACPVIVDAQNSQIRAGPRLTSVEPTPTQIRRIRAATATSDRHSA